MIDLAPLTARARVAFFSMEIGIRPEMHCYSGGLGVLAGDIARSAAELDVPMVFVTLVSRQGYVRQEIDRSGQQVDHPDPWQPEQWATLLDGEVTLRLEGREVVVRAWLHELACGEGSVPILLLDTDWRENDGHDRAITDRLYGGDMLNRLRQEAVLGIAGQAMLRMLGFAPERYHLNEGHSAFLTASLLNEGMSEAEVRDACLFTTHTPVAAGHDRFAWPDVERVLGELIDVELLRQYAPGDELNMTHLALALSGYANAVARRHAETARALFPDHLIHAITNGVHPGQWVHAAMAALFDRHASDWRRHPEHLAGAATAIDDGDLWAAHQNAKQALIDRVRAATGVAFDADLPLIGIARRMTAYKRPDLLLSDLDRLRAIARRHPVQILVAGKAHPNDLEGKAIIARIEAEAKALAPALPIAFLPGYDMAMAGDLVAGCDVWLNNPVPPLEASGTSGMKAAMNGVLNLSVLDGWWVEGCEEGVTGWSFGAPDAPEGHAAALYDKLEQAVLPLYGDRAGWAAMMKQAIARLTPAFSSHRMLHDYVAAYRLGAGPHVASPVRESADGLTGTA